MLDLIHPDFHFVRPLWFLALIPLAWVIWRMGRRAVEEGGWAGVIDKALVPYVLVSGEDRSDHWPRILIGLLGVFAIIALAGPVWEKLPQPVYHSQSALVIALDLSRSMDATDLKPSRLARARYKVADLLKKRKEGQTSLLVFAADAYTVTPLTDDTNTILSQLNALSTDLMPRQGSRADRAMKKAGELLKQAGVLRGDILLITDGVDADRDGVAAAEMKKKGYRVFVLGIGTEEGAPIPEMGGGYFTDASGTIVLPKLNENALEGVAKAGGGSYQRYTFDDRDVEHLSIQFDRKPLKSEMVETELQFDIWRETGPWLLLFILPFAAYIFRQGYLVIVIFCASGITAWSPQTEAADLWLRHDQKAQRLFEEGEHEKAARLFEDPRWKGSAQYRAGDYEAALKSWESLDDAEALYNKGNALAKMGKLEEALEKYKEALQKSPEFEDAQYNYDQVKKALEEQKQQQKENKKQQDDQQNKSEQGGGGEDKKGERSRASDSKQNDQQQLEKNEKDQQQSEQKGEEGEKGKDQAAGKEQGEQKGNSRQEEQQESQLNQGRSDASSEEEQQAVEAALRAIPDDPGGLLRRKFKYQYRQQVEQSPEDEESKGQQW